MHLVHCCTAKRQATYTLLSPVMANWLPLESKTARWVYGGSGIHSFQVQFFEGFSAVWGRASIVMGWCSYAAELQLSACYIAFHCSKHHLFFIPFLYNATVLVPVSRKKLVNSSSCWLRFQAFWRVIVGVYPPVSSGRSTFLSPVMFISQEVSP